MNRITQTCSTAAEFVGQSSLPHKGSGGAKIVAVAGSFNGWNQSQFLFARIDGEWVCRINLPPGRYLYKIIVDANWIVDPANDVTERDDRGNVNSVLTVE